MFVNCWDLGTYKSVKFSHLFYRKCNRALWLVCLNQMSLKMGVILSLVR